MTAALLTLADSRLPAGGHTHSGGVEQAIAAGLVRDPASLAAFLLRRLQTAGRVAAGLAGAACRGGDLAAL
ncbi:urease accessory protein, partial [Geodermatophilus nigrescens]